MLTSARIEALNALGGLSWITAPRAPAIATLAADDGPLRLSPFDTADLAEITHPDYPGQRLIARRDPALAAERARKRPAPLAATEAALAPIAAAVAAGRLAGADRIGVKIGKVIDRYQDGHTLHHHDHRQQPDADPPRRADRRRGRPGWHLPAAHPPAHRETRRPRRGGRRQKPRRRRTRLRHPSRPSICACARSVTTSPIGSAPTC